jgi:hypothetical protein
MTEFVSLLGVGGKWRNFRIFNVRFREIGNKILISSANIGLFQNFNVYHIYL